MSLMLTCVSTLTKVVPLVAIVLCPALQQRQTETATIHVRIVDVRAHDVGEARIESFKQVEFFSSRKNRKDYASRFHQNTASDIPYGIYHLRVSARGFWSAERDVRVFQSDVRVVVQLELGMGSDEGGFVSYPVSGRVKNLLPSSEPVWVKLVGVYSGVNMETKVSSSGDFILNKVPQGGYVLITIRETKILDCRPVEVPMSAPVLIELRTDKSNSIVKP